MTPRSLALLCLPLAGGVALATPARATTPDCDGLIAAASTAIDTRPLQPIDLVRLRDFGSIPDFTESPIFGLSPDGSRLAVQVRRVDPVSNGFCLGMAVIALDGTGAARLVDRGGEFIRWHFPELSGKADFPSGFAKVITPRWFPDGKSIAFLKRDGDTVQVWKAAADGGGSSALTQSQADVLDFRIVEDGRAIIYSSNPALAVARKALVQESRQGFHYDDRFSPMASNEPFPAPPIARKVLRLDLHTGATRPATRMETELLANGDFMSDAGKVEVSATGRRAWARPMAQSEGPRRLGLSAQTGDGRDVICPASACSGITGALWWSTTGRIRFMRREGWANSLTVIYEWTPGTETAKRLFATKDLLFGCQPLADDLICAHEASTQPRHLVRLRLAAGEVKTLFDPNPEFRHLTIGQVERLQWKTDAGVETFGDLIYPADYTPGRRYPLIIVQYRSRGFLRGGTGDENPIQAYASRGYFVLSLDRPQSPVRLPASSSAADRAKADLAGFVDRRNVLSAIEIAVRRLVDRGLVDQARIGLTGLSDGASTVQYAVLHSDLFAAASVSGCCWEPGMAAMLGPDAVRDFPESGWPRLTDKADGFWSQISWVRNADRIRAPILFQMADREFRSTLEPYTAIHEAGGVADIFVFPDETHVKWQPAHRLAIYERNIAWFDFWLKDEDNSLIARPAEVARWKAARDQREKQRNAMDMRADGSDP